MKSSAKLLGLLGLLAMLGAGCESDSVPDHGSIRVENRWDQPVHLFLDDEPRLTIDPGMRGQVAVNLGFKRISIRNVAGKEIFGQTAEVPDNTFAEYIVAENGAVIATAGNIRVPDIVGGGDRQVRVDNDALFPVSLLIDGVEIAVTAPGDRTTVAVTEVPMNILVRGENRDLFKQTLAVPRNTAIIYFIMEDGTVAASGGAISKNIDKVVPVSF